MFDYTKTIKKALDRSLKSSPEEKLDIGAMKVVIFSDHHRGQKDAADDFRNNESTYRRALESYLSDSYRLFLLGDVEELWEIGNPEKILERYESIFQFEKRFADKGLYARFYGNHDDLWESTRKVKKFLSGYIGESPLYNSTLIGVYSGGSPLGEIFIAHGHQGTLFSDILRKLSKPFVRYAWRPIQKLLKIGYTSPATDYKLRQRHEVALHAWAQDKRGLILIAGHTHHPVFMSESHEYQLARDIDLLNFWSGETSDAEEKRKISEELKVKEKLLKRKLRDSDGVRFEIRKGDKPCYFNTGCCSFKDGDISCIEIDNGEIRLIVWDKKKNRNVKRVASLRDLFGRCN